MGTKDSKYFVIWMYYFSHIIIQHDNGADPDCVNPPNCLRLDDLRERASRVRPTPGSKNNLPPIHVHINNPLSDVNTNSVSHASRHLKRCRSASTSDSSDSDEECLLVSEIINQLYRKYPQLDLPQYLPVLKEHGIIYADSVGEFSKDYYAGLGMADGSVVPFLSGVRRALKQVKKGKKRVKITNKENNRAYARQESSVEI